MTRRILAVACGAALISGGPAIAELVYFARGGQAQIPATIDGELVRLDSPDGPKFFSKNDFAAIIPGHRPIDEWAARRDIAIKDGGIDAGFAAAWWAFENGLTDQAIACLDELRPIASTSGPANRAIAAIDRLAPPCPDPDLEPLRKCLKPLRFREARSPHVILFHQHGETEAIERLDLIERVIKTFLATLAAKGFELSAPGHRLISVYMADHRDYAEILRRLDGDAFTGTQGYYHPVLRSVFGFDARSSAEQQAGRRAILNREAAGESPSELARRTLLLDLDWRATDLGILAHETVHQLTSECGLAPRSDDFPTWLHEGVAAQFEVVRGGRWAGFGRINDRRLPDWRSINPEPRLTPLLRDVGFGGGYRRDLYAESWALVYFLEQKHPREFRAFLDLLRTPRADSIVHPDRAFEAFRSSFGDLARLETEWHRFLSDVRTPLEAGRPDVR